MHYGENSPPRPPIIFGWILAKIAINIHLNHRLRLLKIVNIVKREIKISPRLVVHIILHIYSAQFHGVVRWPNDPKLSHGASNCKREIECDSKRREYSPLAPALC